MEGKVPVKASESWYVVVESGRGRRSGGKAPL